MDVEGTTINKYYLRKTFSHKYCAYGLCYCCLSVNRTFLQLPQPQLISQSHTQAYTHTHGLKIHKMVQQLKASSNRGSEQVHTSELRMEKLSSLNYKKSVLNMCFEKRMIQNQCNI